MDTVFSIEYQFQTIRNKNGTSAEELTKKFSSRQENISNIVCWTNLLHPISDLPFSDRVYPSVSSLKAHEIKILN